MTEVTACRWCCEPTEQAETGRPRSFCDDACRQAYNRRKATAPPTWEEFPYDSDGPMTMAMWEAEKRLYAAHPERTPPSWLFDIPLYTADGRLT